MDYSARSMALVSAEVAIRGTRALLWHRFGTDAIPLERKKKHGVAGNNPEEWRKTVLQTPKGQLYLEPTYVFGCLRDAAKHTSIGRGSLQPKIVATLQILDSQILIDRSMPKGKDPAIGDDSEPVYIDVRSVRNPATRARNIRYRVAASIGWLAQFKILWDDTIVSEGQMEAVIRDAGPLQGLGDGRSIGFGRFELVSFKLIDRNNAKKPTAKRAVARTKA
jgi:hypothetical protein